MTDTATEPATQQERRRIFPKGTKGAHAALVILFGLNVADELAWHAFSLLTPEIKAAFHLSNFGLGNVLLVPSIIGVAGIPIIGWLGDRGNRARVTQAAAVIAFLGALTLGIAPAVLVLILGKILIDTGRFVPETIHNSIIADLYEPEQRPLAFGIHRGGNELGFIIAPLFGAVVANFFGWRWAFFAALIPLGLMILASLRLVEPVRGITERRPDEEALEADAEPPVPYGVAVRQLWTIKTLRRTWISMAFIFAAALPYFAFAQIFYSVSFGATILSRGVVGGVSSVFGLLGLYAGGVLSKRAMERSLGTLQRFVGVVVAVGAVTLCLFALMPSYPLAIVFGALNAFVFALNQSAQLVVLSLVSPPRLRSVAYSFGSYTGLVGIFAIPIVGGVVDHYGVRVGLVACTPVLLIGGLILASAGKYAADDHERAVRTLDLAAELRAERRAAAQRSLLRVRGLDVSYGTVQVLFGVDFEVGEGEVVALLGTNGAGKSTLLKAVSGLIVPDGGNIFFEGNDVIAQGPWDTAKAGIVLMPGGKSVFPELTVRQNLDLATWLYRKDKAFVQQRMEEVLDLFPRVRERLDQRAGDLSGGEQQQLSLAQAFIPDPKLLLLDELSLGLSPKLVGELVAIIGEIRARRPDLTIVLVEQSVNVAMTLAERAYFMEKGEIRFSGRTADLLERPDILRAVFLEGAAKATATEAERT
jgi:branched-chain amino acid transport system ATP-binding protein